MTVEFIGYFAALVELFMGAPQALQSFRQRNDEHALRGVSALTVAATTVHALLWVIYGVLSHQFPIVLAHLVILPSYFLTLYFVLRSRLKIVQKTTMAHNV